MALYNFIDLSATKFSINGRELFKTFTPVFLQNDKISVTNIYDSTQFLIDNALVSDIDVDGVIYANATLLINNLVDVIFVPAGEGTFSQAQIDQNTADILALQTDKADANHNHNTLYYLKTEIDTIIANLPTGTEIVSGSVIGQDLIFYDSLSVEVFRIDVSKCFEQANNLTFVGGVLTLTNIFGNILSTIDLNYTLKPTITVYEELVNLYADQANQVTGGIYEVVNVNDFTYTTGEVEHNVVEGPMWLRYKGTTNGDYTDYQGIGVPSGGYTKTIIDLDNAKQDKDEKGQPLGYAPLNGLNKIPDIHLPDASIPSLQDVTDVSSITTNPITIEVLDDIFEGLYVINEALNGTALKAEVIDLLNGLAAEFLGNILISGKINLNDGGDSVFIGTNSGLNDDGTFNRNIGIGTSAMQNNTTGNDNTAIGYVALQNNTTGNNNVAVGYQAMLNNTAGSNNVAVGYQALLNNKGTNNVAVGFQAMRNNTTGVNNVGIGISALLNNTTGSNNAALGNQAMLNNTTGGNNLAFGYQCMRNNTTGVQNVSIGIGAGELTSFNTNLTSCNNSIFIGANVKPLDNGQTNQIVIGHNGVGAGSNTTVIGNDDTLQTYLKGDVIVASEAYGLDWSGNESVPTKNDIFDEMETKATQTNGAFLPDLTPSTSGSYTFTRGVCNYNKVGNIVFLTISFSAISSTTPLGNLEIDLNLPFTVNTTGNQFLTVGVFTGSSLSAMQERNVRLSVLNGVAVFLHNDNVNHTDVTFTAGIIQISGVISID